MCRVLGFISNEEKSDIRPSQWSEFLSITFDNRALCLFQNRVHQLENSLQDLQREVQRLSEELTKKDARIKELSTIMPWKSEESRGENINLESEEGAFVIGENEFVV